MTEINKKNPGLEMRMARADVLADTIKNMGNELILDEFEKLIRIGAGHDYQGVIYMKREILRRMDREEPGESVWQPDL
jgi:hypothetical protein